MDLLIHGRFGAIHKNIHYLTYLAEKKEIKDKHVVDLCW